MFEFTVFMQDATGTWQGQEVTSSSREDAVHRRVAQLADPGRRMEVWTTGKDQRSCVTLVKHVVRVKMEVTNVSVETVDNEEEE